MKAAHYRILHKGQQVWPEDGKWFDFSGSINAIADIPEIEIQAELNDTIEFQIYATSSGENTDDQRIDLTFFPELFVLEHETSATVAIYDAVKMYPQMDGYYTALPGGRFSYELLDVKNDFAPMSCNTFTKAWNNQLYDTIHGADTTFKHWGSEVCPQLTPDWGAQIRFVAPEEGLGTLTFSPASGAYDAEIYCRVRLNGVTVWPKTGEWQMLPLNRTALTVQLSGLPLKKGDNIEIQKYSTQSVGSNYGVLKILFQKGSSELPQHGVTVRNPNATITTYTPYESKPIPYPGDSYVPITGPWEFLTMTRSGDGFVDVPCNAFTPGWDNNVWNTSTWAGYYFWDAEQYVTTNIPKNQGIALSFTVPETSELYLQTLAEVVRESRVGTIKLRVVQNGENIWPESGWASIEHPVTGQDDKITVPVIKTSAEKGDVIRFEVYCESQEDGGMRFRFGKILISDVLVTATDKTWYSNYKEYCTQVNLDPYWSYEYSPTVTNPVFSKMENWHSSWGYFYASGYDWLGCNGDRLWVADEYERHGYGIAAYTFNVPKGGYLTLAKTRIQPDDSINMRVRITHNGDVIWPEDGGWKAAVSFEPIMTQETIYEVEEGDVLRFECTMATDAPAKKGGQVSWPLDFTLGNTSNSDMLGDSLDLYDGLSIEDALMFKEMSSLHEFDVAFAANQKQAEKNEITVIEEPSENIDNGIIAEKEQKEEKENENEQTDGGITQTKTSSKPVKPKPTAENDGGNGLTSGKAPGKKVVTSKKIVYTYGLPTWAILLIVFGGILLASGTLFVLYKKRLIFKKAVFLRKR